jgi:antitoxin HicB
MSYVKDVKPAEPPYPFEAYTHVITPLGKDEGGGYLITFPDLPGCMSDGETEEEAIENGRDAFIGWVTAQIEMNHAVPEPTWQPETVPARVSGKFVQRVPKTLHARLVRRAKAEGVSLNSLVLSFISEGLGKKQSKTSRTSPRRSA